MNPLFGLEKLANKHPEIGRNIQKQRSHLHHLKSPKTRKET
jgi:hypothetical protein